MINRFMSLLLDELRADGISDPLAQSFTLAALWDDLAAIAGEVPPPFVDDFLAGGVPARRIVPTVGERLAASAAFTTQDLHLALIARLRFNTFDGIRVVADLQDYPERWRAALMCSSNLDKQLRDLARGEHRLDTLYLATTEEHVADLTDWALRRRALSVHRCRPEGPFGCGGWTGEGVVLRLWWP